MPTYRIADIPVRFIPEHSMLHTRSEKYRIEGTVPSHALGTDRTVIEEMHQELPQLTHEECEYMHLGREFYSLLLQYDGMMLHASAVVVGGFAYLFSAPSGTGKSTHTALWLQKFGSDAYLLNDDKPALRVFHEGVYAYGTPFSGKYDLSVNERVPLRGIAFLERSETNRMERMTGREALYALLNQTVRPRDVPLYTKLLHVVQIITQTVPIYKLYCNMDPQAAELSYETMRKGIEE